MGQLFSSLPPMGKSPLNALAGLSGAAPAAAKLQTGLATAALLKSTIPPGAATAAMGTLASLPKPSIPAAPVVPAAKPVAPVVPAAKPAASVVPAPKPAAPVVPRPTGPPPTQARPVVLPKRKGGARKSRSTKKKSRRNARR
jgi:hypothetical protein